MSKRRVNVRGIVRNSDNKILAVQHQDSSGKVAKYWATPGGGLDPHESLVDGLRREFIEELGVAPTIGRLLLIQQFSENHKGYDEQLELFFEVTNVEDFKNIDLTATTHGALEIAKCEFIDVTKFEMLPAIIATDEFQNALSNPNAPVVLYNELKNPTHS